MAYDLIKECLIPEGNSNTNFLAILNTFAGILGLNSIVKKSLKLALGSFAYNFFSNSFNQLGAKCTFFNTSHSPDLILLAQFFSTNSNPSLEPIAIDKNFLFSCLAKASILVDASKPGALQNKIGVLQEVSSLITLSKSNSGIVTNSSSNMSFNN